MKVSLIVFLLMAWVGVFAQISEKEISTRYASAFAQAYSEYPDIPKGVLEAVAYTNTRIRHIVPENEDASCIGMPSYYGVMGLIDDGKNYFRSSLSRVSELSGYSKDEIKSSPQINILAFASAYRTLEAQLNTGKNINNQALVLQELSELPIIENNLGNDFALKSYLFSVYVFLSSEEKSNLYSFPKYAVDFEGIFGKENLKVLSAKKVTITESEVSGDGVTYELKNLEATCPDYPVTHCSWVSSPHYSSRSGTAITAIAIHTVQGSYSGCISWFQNPSSQVSTHYVVRSSDGQLTQMVLEANKAWHVGAENPYTIGYEHEGYVTDPAWYTIAMYRSSADLTKDVCNGHNIDSYRVFYRDTLDDGTVLDYGIHSLGGDGSCIKIKGHQHFPNNTHTDPGPHWNWDLYFKLINKNPAITTITNATGTFYDSGGAGSNYGDDERILTLIKPTNAETVTINFTSWSVEANYDFMYIYDGETEFAPLIGRFNTQSPGTITSTGGALLIEWRSDCATYSSGWIANWTSTVGDLIAPTTAVSVTSDWKTTDFTADFTDADNAGGSGVEKAFYQVIDYNGSDWRANDSAGFFSDNFDLPAINSDWTSATGTWSISSSHLLQSDESQSNTNIYTYLNESLSNRYLYHWAGSIGGSGTNRRAGFHYFCDQPNLTNRGNSYFVWFRLDDDAIQLYKVTNDVFTLVADKSYNLNQDQWYDFKVTYDRITGLHRVYINDALQLSYTDSSPISSGDYISFRSGNSVYSVNNLKVYRSRYPSVTVTVGSGAFARYQNQNPSTPAARVKSIVQDVAGNISTIEWQDVNIDWTAPSDIVEVRDGTAADIDITQNNNTLYVNWDASVDVHSQIKQYWICAGDTPGGTNILGWTSAGSNTAYTSTGLSLTDGTTVYYSVKAENNAGLFSNVTTSDGQTYSIPVDPPTASFAYSATTICEGTPVEFYNLSVSATSYLWSFENGTPATSTDENPIVVFGAGDHQVQLIAYGGAESDTLIQMISVTTIPNAVAAFSALDNTLQLPGATAYFINNSTGSSSYHWNFGDGETSTDQSPWHEYQFAGAFDITLIAYGTCGTDTAFVAGYIQVDNATPVPYALYEVQQPPYCDGKPIEFTNRSENAVSWQWTFENGTPATSNTEHPVVYFPAGNHLVTLDVSGPGGTDSYQTTVNLSYTAVPTANFYALQTELAFPNTNAYFVNTSSDADSYIWDFGDGLYSADASPWHTYQDTGTFSVMLVAISSQCDNDTLYFQDYVHVTDPTAVVSLEHGNTINVIPNPFENQFAVITNMLPGTKAMMEIFDIAGRVILSKEVEIGSNGDFLVTSMSAFENGSYILNLQAGDHVMNYTLVKCR